MSGSAAASAPAGESAEVPDAPGIRWWRWLRRGGLLLVTVVVVEYLVLPQLVGARDDMSLIGSARPWPLASALALEAASLLCFSALSRASLPPGGRPSYVTLLRIDLSGLGLSHVVPGGGATAAAFRYRLLTRAGVPAGDAVSGTTVQTAASLVVLMSIFISGVLLSLPQALDEPAYLSAGVVAAVLLAVLATGAVLLTRHRPATLAVVRRLGRRLPRSWGDRLARTLARTLGALGRRIELLVRDRRLLARTVVWCSGNWILDATALWLCLLAYGFEEPVGPLLALYGAVSLLAMVPTTPGGLGLVEGVLIPALVSVGAEPSVALLGVLTWRLVEYWLPIPVALLTYLSLRLGVLRPRAGASADP